MTLSDNINLKSTLLKNGFVKITFLDEEQLRKLQNQLTNLNATYKIANIDYHVSLLSKDIDYKNQIQSILFPIFSEKIKSLFSDYFVLHTNLIIKNPHTGEVPLHQNWTFVDEKKFRSYTLWIPLTDTDETNGTLEFIIGSHQLFYNEKRGHNTPYFFINDAERLKEYLISITVKAGEALLFDDAMLHYSKPNLTDNSRIAIQATLVPETAPLYHYHYEKGCIFDKIYEMPIDVIFNESMSIKPDKKKYYYQIKKRKITNEEWRQLSDLHKLYLNNNTTDI